MFFHGKSFLLASFTLLQVPVHSKTGMTNLSILFIASSGISFGPFARLSSASISSGCDFYEDHAHFPCPAKLDTMSQPVLKQINLA